MLRYRQSAKIIIIIKHFPLPARIYRMPNTNNGQLPNIAIQYILRLCIYFIDMKCHEWQSYSSNVNEAIHLIFIIINIVRPIEMKYNYCPLLNTYNFAGNGRRGNVACSDDQNYSLICRGDTASGQHEPSSGDYIEAKWLAHFKSYEPCLALFLYSLRTSDAYNYCGFIGIVNCSAWASNIKHDCSKTNYATAYLSKVRYEMSSIISKINATLSFDNKTGIIAVRIADFDINRAHFTHYPIFISRIEGYEDVKRWRADMAGGDVYISLACVSSKCPAANSISYWRHRASIIIRRDLIYGAL